MLLPVCESERAFINESLLFVVKSQVRREDSQNVNVACCIDYTTPLYKLHKKPAVFSNFSTLSIFLTRKRRACCSCTIFSYDFMVVSHLFPCTFCPSILFFAFNHHHHHHHDRMMVVYCTLYIGSVVLVS